MLLPLSVWVWIGEQAVQPSRKRRAKNPWPTLTVGDAAEIVGDDLCAPFVPNQAAIEAYRTTSGLVQKVDGSLEQSGHVARYIEWLLKPKNENAVKFAEMTWSRYGQIAADLIRLLNEPAWQHPVNVEAESTFPELEKFRHMNYVMQLQASLLWSKGQESEALAYLRAAYAFSNRVRDSQGLFIHEAVGRSSKRRLLSTIRAGLRAKECTQQMLDDLDNLIGSEVLAPDRVKCLFEREFRFACVPGARLRGTPEAHKYEKDRPSSVEIAAYAQSLLIEWTFRDFEKPFDREELLREMRGGYDQIMSVVGEGWPVAATLKALSKAYGDQIPPGYKSGFLDTTSGITLEAVTDARAKFARMNNPLNKLRLWRLFATCEQVVASMYKGQAELLATRIFIATAKWRKLGARGPLDSLYTLVNAGFLNEIPSDPTSGLPFLFDPQTQAVWLPGPNNLTFEQAYKTNPGRGPSWLWVLPKAKD